MKEIKKYQFWHKVFLLVGFYGLLDIIIGVFLKQSGMGPENNNGLTIIIARIFKYLFGTDVAISLISPMIIISSTWFIWLGISEVIRRKVKKLKKESGTTDKVVVEKLDPKK